MAGEIINLATFNLDTQKLQSNLNDLQDTYFDLRKEQQEYAKQTKETAKQIELLAKTQKTLTDSAGDNTEAIEKNDKELQDLLKTQKELYKSEQNLGIQMGTVRKEINQTTTQLRSYQDAEGKTSSLIDLGNQALGRQIKNKNDARAANIALNNVANQLNPNIEEENQLLIKLNAQMDKNTAFIKNNSSETAKQKMNIGNYTESVKNAIQESGLMSNTLQSLGASGKVAEIGIKLIGAATKDVKQAYLEFIGSLGIGTVAQEANAAATATQVAAQEANVLAQAEATASVLALEAAEVTATEVSLRYAAGTATEAEAHAADAAVISAQTASTEALSIAQGTATAVTTASTGALKLFRIALISTGIGAIVVLLGSLISFLTGTQAGIDKVSAVLEPLKAIFSALGSVLTTIGGKLVSVFENPKKALNNLYEFVKGNLINRFKAFGVILEGIITLDFKKVTNGALQAGTGIENLTDKIQAGVKASGKFLDENIKKGQQIAAINKLIGSEQLKYNANQIAFNDAVDAQLLISKDTSKSFQERAAAANEIIRLTEANGRAERAILELELQRLKIQQSIRGLANLTNEDKQEEIDLLTKIDAAEDRGLNARLEQSRVLAGLQKEQQEASKKASEERLKRIQEEQDAAIKAMQTELDIYLADQGDRKKSMAEQNAIDQEAMRQALAINAAEFDAKKKTRREFELENINISNEFLAKQVELTMANAELEYDIQIEKNARILENDKYLSEQQFLLKQEALANQLKADQEFQLTRLAQGEINEQEYNAAINTINEENRLANEELATERKASEQEKALLDLENQKIINEENFLAQAEIEKAQNEIKRQQEVANAEQTGADISLINAKYAKMQEDIEATKQANKVQLASDAFGSLATIFGAESKAGKAAAVAQTTIDTYKSAQSAFSSLSGIPIVGPILGAIAAAAAIAAGIANVKKITSTKTPSVSKTPSYASGVIGLRGSGSGTSDDVSANLSAGESVINARSTSMFANELSAINQAGGGVGINGASNILNQNDLNNNANNSQLVSMIAEAVAIGAEAGTKSGSQSGIKELSNDRKVMADAKF
jgi:hypothetical protein